MEVKKSEGKKSKRSVCIGSIFSSQNLSPEILFAHFDDRFHLKKKSIFRSGDIMVETRLFSHQTIKSEFISKSVERYE
jgi:hypothetical protein